MVTRNIAIIQARLNSMRFPEKIIKKLGDTTVLEFLVKRLKKSKKIDMIILATSDNSKELINITKKNKIKIFVLSSNPENVLKRFYKCSVKYHLKDNDNIIRITGDCPFIDPKLVDRALIKINEGNYDLVSNTFPSTYPDGLDFSIFKLRILKQTYKSAKKKYDMEHVTSMMYRNKKIKKFNIKSPKNYSKLRLTVDTPQDLIYLNQILKRIEIKNFSLKDLIKIIKKYKREYIERNIGSKMSDGYKLWGRATNIIAGGNMLLSKRPDNFLPLKWPSYFNKAKGCYVWDLNNKKYIDLCMMGVGTSLLGYANSKIDKAVKKRIDNGIVSTLNSKEDITLAEMLIKLDPWSDMVKFARSGGEALAISIRLARSYSKKLKILFCGYHGWHDWYLSANVGDNKRLDKHLISNLKVNGVPKILKNSSCPFNYNDISDFKKKFGNGKNIAGVIMEVERNKKPNKKFLNYIRNITKNKKIPLIFDECTTGFRETNSGIYKKYKIIPDIVMYGKSLSNGYAFSALVGKKEIMQQSEQSFISSTTWTENVGPTAAIATLTEMSKIKSWKKISLLGKYLKNKWRNIARKNNLKVKIYGIDAIPKFEIISNHFLIYKTFITQEMLKNGILANNIVYISTCHTKIIINKYLKILDRIFRKIADVENNKLNPKELLNSNQASEEFKKN
tara:strand:- start:1330 stop:3357 length:2028 start_codon:yes stop_codon:yes gene_type:complete